MVRSKESSAYWLERAKEKDKVMESYELAFMRDMRKEYAALLKAYRARIYTFYGRYADEYGLILPENMSKFISHSEFLAFQKTLTNAKDKLDLQNDIYLKDKINKTLKKTKLTRQEKLFLQMEISANKLAQSKNMRMTSTLTDEMKEIYGFTAFTIEKATQTKLKYGLLRQQAISDTLNFPWSGKNYSERIWNDKDQLISNVRELITREQVQGKLVRDISKDLAERMQVELYKAERLIRTESSYIANQATQQLYEAANIDKYEYLAIEDSRTSDICNNLDGKIFKNDEGVPGENMPPMHPNCRSTIIPVLDNEKLSIQGE